ncbi:hypothetical protein ACFL4K_00035 [Candidatus Neomarinimicrobiota bacterium]
MVSVIPIVKKIICRGLTLHLLIIAHEPSRLAVGRTVKGMLWRV